MGLPWVRLDTALPDHPKILALVDGHKDGRAAIARARRKTKALPPWRAQ